jgi:hypothetical protein
MKEEEVYDLLWNKIEIGKDNSISLDKAAKAIIELVDKNFCEFATWVNKNTDVSVYNEGVQEWYFKETDDWRTIKELLIIFKASKDGK